MEPTRFRELNVLLRDFAAGVGDNLGDDLVGVYLQGSFALGDADEHSDVDFVVVVERDPTDAQRAALQALHQRLYARDTPWAQHLEGSYFPIDAVRRLDAERRPLVYLDNGATELTEDPHCNTAVVRWTLREHGVVLTGPPPRELVDPVSPADLRAEALATLREYVEWASESQERFEAACGGAPAMSRWKQPYLVLTFCRILHLLEHGHPASKRRAAEWARDALPPRWAPLVQRALDDRPDPWGRVHRPASREDIRRTLEFAEFAARTAATLGP